MSAVSEIESTTELLKLDPETYATAVYKPFRDKLSGYLLLADKPVPDASNPTGMKTCVALRAAGRGIRTGIEKARVERKAPVLEIGRLLDAKAKALTLEVSPAEAKYDAEIKRVEAIKESERKAREAAELARIEGHQNRIAAIRSTADGTERLTATLINDRWHELADLDLTGLEEFGPQAERARNETLDRLTALFTAATEREEEAARLKAEREELDRLRAEHDERERVAAVERIEQERIAEKLRQAEAAAAKAERDEILRQQDALIRQQQEFAARAAREKAAKAGRPTDMQIVAALALHYGVDVVTALNWLTEMDMDALAQHILKEEVA